MARNLSLQEIKQARKAMEKMGILEEVSPHAAVAQEEIDIIDKLTASGKIKAPDIVDRITFSAAELAEGNKSLDDRIVSEHLLEGRRRKSSIRKTAEAIASERGDDLRIPAKLKAFSWLIKDSAPEQRIYREYLKGVIAEQEHIAHEGAAFSAYDNEHPVDHGGSPNHFQELARNQNNNNNRLLGV